MIEGTDEGEKVRNEDEMRAGIGRGKENVIYNSYVQTLRDIQDAHPVAKMADRRLPARQGVDFRIAIVCQLAQRFSLSPFSRSPRDSSCFTLPLPLALFRVASSFVPTQLYLCLSLMCTTMYRETCYKFRVKFCKYAYLLYRDINLYDFAFFPHMKSVTRKK